MEKKHELIIINGNLYSYCVKNGIVHVYGKRKRTQYFRCFMIFFFYINMSMKSINLVTLVNNNCLLINEYI